MYHKGTVYVLKLKGIIRILCKQLSQVWLGNGMGCPVWLAFEGHRWFDLRRTTRPEIKKEIEDVTYTLVQDDSRYTLRIPQDAIDANPGLLN